MVVDYFHIHQPSVIPSSVLGVMLFTYDCVIYTQLVVCLFTSSYKYIGLFSVL